MTLNQFTAYFPALPSSLNLSPRNCQPRRAENPKLLLCQPACSHSYLYLPLHTASQSCPPPAQPSWQHVFCVLLLHHEMVENKFFFILDLSCIWNLTEHDVLSTGGNNGWGGRGTRHSCRCMRTMVTSCLLQFIVKTSTQKPGLFNKINVS